MKFFLNGFLDLFFPRNCVITGNAVDDESPFQFISSEGFKDLRLINGACCRTCGFPFWGLLAGQQRCPHCCELEPEFNEGRALFLSDGAGRRIVHHLKYHNAMYLLQDVERIVRQQESFVRFFQGAVFVPVALHKRRLRERGYNQAMLLAEVMAKVCDGSIADCLRRVRDTKSQTQFDRGERARNVCGAFVCDEGYTSNATVRYVLVDDVFTTGATFNACAHALKQSGATNIDVCALAHG